MRLRKLGFIGAGQMAQSMIRAILDGGLLPKEQIFVSSRTEGRLDKVIEKFQVQRCRSNEEVVDKSDWVVLAMKPQDLAGAVEPVRSVLRDEQLVISLAAGFTLNHLKSLIPDTVPLARVMCNTPIRIRKAAVAYALSSRAGYFEDDLKELLSPLGAVFSIPDGEAFQAFTIASATGTGFVLELMQYWQDWIEGYGISPDVAKEITTQTFLGTAALAEKQAQQSFEELQSHVVSKRGTTAAGLDSIRENDVERMLRLSFEKAALRDTELSKLL